jgi:hypothetical protein
MFHLRGTLATPSEAFSCQKEETNANIDFWKPCLVAATEALL